MESINIAVIGADGVGKSAFIQRALLLPRPPSLNVTSLRQDVEGAVYVVTLVEIGFEVFDVDPNQPIQWPGWISGHVVRRIDGALIVYDVKNKESIRDLPTTMSALAHSFLPAILVATKCDTPENLRQLQTAGVASAFPSIVCDYQVSHNVPRSAQDCLQAMLKACVAARREAAEKFNGSISRRRSDVIFEAHTNIIHGRPLSTCSKQNRASSDLSLLSAVALPAVDSVRARSKSPRMDNHPPQVSHSTPSLSDASEDGGKQTLSSMLRTPGVGTESFLDMEESDGESVRHSDEMPVLQRNEEVLDKPAKAAGMTFDALVDRLLAPKMSRADYNFLEVFLCLYRNFAAPNELFSAVLRRLDRVKEDRTVHYLTKTETQLRYIEVVSKWVSLYPGDFARPKTRKKLAELIKHLSTEPIFAAAAQQMHAYLTHKVAEDDDTGWAKSDEADRDEMGASETASGTEADSRRRPSQTNDSISSLQMDEIARRQSQSSYISILDVQSRDRTPARFQYYSVEDYEREAATMVPTATLPLNKFRYYIFMDMDSDDIADEITRIDWVMFSSIRIRDLVRSVSLSLDQRERCKSLVNVNRMVSHFNHVANWVANMILIRDKAKHRAPCLEKIMIIALRLRQLNNYNGLAAVLAGIQCSSIYRLSQTMALVSIETTKRFKRLDLLMGSQKSHFAYRLAWENSPLPRIPFMPLHRRDLVSAEEGSRMFIGPVGDRINWKKFEVLGEVILPIMRSQTMPYPNLHRHEPSHELILECRMLQDEEDVYQRSVTVEPTSAAAAESSKKKFSWLAK